MIKSVVHFDDKCYGQKGDRDVYCGKIFENSNRVVRKKSLSQQGTSDVGLKIDEGASWTDSEEEYITGGNKNTNPVREAFVVHWAVCWSMVAGAE